MYPVTVIIVVFRPTAGWCADVEYLCTSVSAQRPIPISYRCSRQVLLLLVLLPLLFCYFISLSDVLILSINKSNCVITWLFFEYHIKQQVALQIFRMEMCSGRPFAFRLFHLWWNGTGSMSPGDVVTDAWSWWILLCLHTVNGRLWFDRITHHSNGLFYFLLLQGVSIRGLCRNDDGENTMVDAGKLVMGTTFMAWSGDVDICCGNGVGMGTLFMGMGRMGLS